MQRRFRLGDDSMVLFKMFVHFIDPLGFSFALNTWHFHPVEVALTGSCRAAVDPEFENGTRSESLDPKLDS